MKNTFALIATLSAFALTACGGGGSDSPVSVNPQTNLNQGNNPNQGNNSNQGNNPNQGNTTNQGNNSNQGNNPNQGNTNTTTDNGTTKPVNTGVSIYSDRAASSSYWFGSSIFTRFPTATEKYFLNIMDTDKDKEKFGNKAEGTGIKTIAVSNDGEWKNILISGNKELAYARFGKYERGDYHGQTRETILFAGGKHATPAEKIRALSGTTAKYSGKAIVLDSQWNATTAAKATLDADFSKKTYQLTVDNIKINNVTYNPVKISTNMSGYTVSPNFAASGTISLAGSFYGKNAEEAAGIFKDKTRGIQGSFGVKKQK